MTYQTLEEIKSERRSGKAFCEIFNNVLASPNLLKQVPEPFTLMEEAGYSLSPQDYVDMTTEEWLKLGVDKQIQYATAYQEWVAKNLKDAIEKEFPINKKRTISMRLIPPGKYWQGAPKNENEDQRKIVIRQPFWCGKYPVTQEQWESLLFTLAKSR
ncbi:MAG: hypothetical protein AABZ60_14750 [Planctomycetota bacterium]